MRKVFGHPDFSQFGQAWLDYSKVVADVRLMESWELTRRDGKNWKVTEEGNLMIKLHEELD